MLISYKNRTIPFNRLVEVYRNLKYKEGNVFSIRYNGLVVAHGHGFFLEKAVFIVEESGRQRVIETNQKNIHAYIKGILKEETLIDIVFFHKVKYDPYINKNFIVEDINHPINLAYYVYFNKKGVFI